MRALVSSSTNSCGKSRKKTDDRAKNRWRPKWTWLPSREIWSPSSSALVSWFPGVFFIPSAGFIHLLSLMQPALFRFYRALAGLKSFTHADTLLSILAIGYDDGIQSKSRGINPPPKHREKNESTSLHPRERLLRWCKRELPSLQIVCGNVAAGSIAKSLCEAGADALRVGGVYSQRCRSRAGFIWGSRGRTDVELK